MWVWQILHFFVVLSSQPAKVITNALSAGFPLIAQRYLSPPEVIKGAGDQVEAFQGSGFRSGSEVNLN